MTSPSDTGKSHMQPENMNSEERDTDIGKLLCISAIGSPILAKESGCAGNPTDSTCPLHRVYAMIDPNMDRYDSLDCSVVVYDVQRALEESDDPEFIEKLRNELLRCPGCSHLLDLEGRMREMMHRACGQHAPAGLREKLQTMLRAVNLECDNDDNDGSD